MNRNVESHFSENPSIDIERSTFDRSSSHKTSFNVGQLIPFFVDEVLPGDTFKVTTAAVVRLQTLLTPIMDNMYMDTYYFFVPNRLVWSHWKEFCGENTASPWAPTTTYSIPITIPPSGGWQTGTIADYLGIPIGTFGSANLYPSSLPFRAYAMICNQWFRSSPLQDPVNVSLGDSSSSGSNGSSQITDIELGGQPFMACKYHDYFTSCLPSPQYGSGVTIFGQPFNSIGSNYDATTEVPVISRAVAHNRSNDGVSFNVVGAGAAGYLKSADTAAPYTNLNISPNATDTVFYARNLYAEVGRLNLSINQLRLAFQMQKWQEKAARGGSRYHELLHEMFSVRPEDARVQIPEYLGGHRFPLTIHQVANQTQDTANSEFLGDLGAMSNTSDVHDDFVKSFSEHGYVIGVCVVRYDHSYPQGIERMWFRSNPNEFYWPVFANIGEQPVRKGELYAAGAGYDVFGYQEAWAEYRYKPNRVSGEMRPGIANSLASWHLSDYYTSTPSLSASWIREDKANVDRCLAVASSVSNQVFCDFYVKNICTRAMPMYSIPGLIDHH